MEYFANQTVVVPVDFSDEAAMAVDRVCEWAEDSTVIHVVHVIEPSYLMVSVAPPVSVPPNYDRDRQQAALDRLQQEFGKEKYPDHSLTLHCRVGDPGTAITDQAEKENATLIVMPSHGRKGFSRMMLGSVAERVVRLASCPVLVLRGDSVGHEKQD